MKPLAQQTLYEILEVPEDSPIGEIEAAYARARETYAPGSIATYSLMSAEESEFLCARLEEARTTLLDPASRARYDARIGAQAAPVESPWPPAFPPVIPALVVAPLPRNGKADEREERSEPGRDVVPDTARPSAWTGPETPRPSAGPIRLEREVAVAPTRTPVPARTPVPPIAATPAAPAREASVPDGTAWTGEVLRQLREARGISLQIISERTKVTRHHIENIEADRYSLLPAPVYLRGILLGIARELRLDGQKVARSYLERMTAAAGTGGSGARR